MGIHGIFKEIGPGQRVSLIKLASNHYTSHNRPFRLAIDISIWLFQIQSGKGGSNPALRTFYYRLLRLLSFNVHPLFVFDGPNKPLFKRNKRVGGPGPRTTSVPEFLAKQLLKHFGFPWHMAPGEAEAECALLQKEAIVDAVLSEDVDTLMFGSGVTLKNWSPEYTSKVPTHVNVYHAVETKENSGLDREGMILVALMSGGDYIPEGIPGCGPKLACNAARAGFGKDLVELARTRDVSGLKAWREKLQHQIRTNEDKLFSRRNTTFTIPDEFPNREVLGYYTHPCVSTAEKLERLREGLKWDQEIDFPALRSFTEDAFEWVCLGGANKFIRNLAPAMLARELRLRGEQDSQLSQDAQEVRESEYVKAIHGKRNHRTTDMELEYRISFIPLDLVPIDLSIEDEDAGFVPAGGGDEQSDAEGEWAALPSAAADDDEDEPSSPSKKRNTKPYYADQLEKVWLVHTFLKLGTPLLVEDYEASLRDPKALLKTRRKARQATAGEVNNPAKKAANKNKKYTKDPKQHHLTTFATVSKSLQATSEAANPYGDRDPLKTVAARANIQTIKPTLPAVKYGDGISFEGTVHNNFSRRLTPTLQAPTRNPADEDGTPKASRQAQFTQEIPRPFAAFASKNKKQADVQHTPRPKRRSDEIVSPAMSQTTIHSYWSPRSPVHQPMNVIDLISPSPVRTELPRASTPTPVRIGTTSLRDSGLARTALERLEDSPGKLPDSVSKRRKRGPLKRHQTAPTDGDNCTGILAKSTLRPLTPEITGVNYVEAMDLASPSPRHIISRDTAMSARPLKQAAVRKKRIQLRESLEGSWREVDAEAIDLSGDGSGWARSQGRANVSGWRKSGVEVLDLTGV